MSNHNSCYLLRVMLVVSSWLLTFPLMVSSHVALTFPAARHPSLDFLDSIRTPAPCGVPKGNVKTSLLTGSTFNVTWHLGYPHRGGYRIEILNQQERPVLNLTVGNGTSFVVGDATALSYQVNLPKDFECRDCTLRLLRQASEWGSTYQFWSCADIDILPKSGYRENCMGHGKEMNGRCQCDSLHHGPRCQYKDECAEDGDCGLHGKCFDIEATSSPRKQCFCEAGWFGPLCIEKSPINSASAINYADYNREDLNDDYAFFWRILPDSQELQGIMVVNGTSYTAIGWRPESLTSSCKSFPNLLPAAQPIRTPNNSAAGSKNKYVPRGDFSGMDCSDIIIGMAKGNYSRIGDYYTRDRSTPQLDSFYGGRQDLTAAFGYQSNGQTVILFRRKLNVSDEADHIIGTEPMQVIWSRGQEAGRYVHSPLSGLEKEKSSISDFYRPDELKYHGKGNQRGITLITFIGDEL